MRGTRCEARTATDGKRSKKPTLVTFISALKILRYLRFVGWKPPSTKRLQFLGARVMGGSETWKLEAGGFGDSGIRILGDWGMGDSEIRCVGNSVFRRLGAWEDDILRYWEIERFRASNVRKIQRLGIRRLGHSEDAQKRVLIASP